MASGSIAAFAGLAAETGDEDRRCFKQPRGNSEFGKFQWHQSLCGWELVLNLKLSPSA